MKNGKSRSAKTWILLLALVLLVGVAAGVTVAWLTDQSDPVVNTFSVGNIDIDLKESKDLNLKMVPGYTLKKDPVVTVKSGSEACWLFVKLEKSTNAKFSDYLSYEIADGWTALDGQTGVYCRSVTAGTEDQAFAVLKNNEVKVLDTVTKTMADSLTEDTYPTLTITAYACQYQKNNSDAFTAADAWAAIHE